MSLLTKDLHYTLRHVDPATGFGLLYSQTYDECLFLNPLATALWNVAGHSIDSNQVVRIFSETSDLPDAATYMESIISDMQRNGLFHPEGDDRPARGDAGSPASNQEYPLGQIYFYATKECNARCYHCYQPTLKVTGPSRLPRPDQLSAAAFLKVIADALPLGLQRVKITGGEASLRPDLADIITGLRALGLNVSIETNGFLIDEALADMFAEHQVDVSISLDGGSAAVHDTLRGQPGSFARVTSALRMLAERGCKPKVIMSISRRNLREVEKVVAVAAQSGCRLVKLNPVNTLGIAQQLQRTGFLLGVRDIMDLYTHRRELEAKFGIFVFLEGPAAFASVYEIATGHSAVCPFTGILGVLSDGSLSFCGIGNSCPELVFGRIDDEGFDIRRFWREAAPLVDVRRLLTSRLEGVCGQCVLEPFCKGSCRALAYGESKRFLAPHPWCQEAFAEGLFPSYYLKEGCAGDGRLASQPGRGVPGVPSGARPMPLPLLEEGR